MPLPIQRIFVLLLILAGTNPAAAAEAAITRPAAAVGMLDVTTVPGVDPTGQSDSTAGINRAILMARDSRPTRTVFFPEGTYLVSGTIRGVHNERGHRAVGSIVLVGSTGGRARPLIKLADAAPGFDDPASPRPVVQVTSEIEGREYISLSYGDGIRGIDIDLGQGNAGAVGIEFEGAQDCFLEDVLIHARDGFAGLTGIPGRNSPTANVEVRGGRHGFFLTRTGSSLGATMAGIRLIGQSGPALVLRNARGLAITGFEIVADHGPVIELRGNSAENSVVPLVDGSVDLRNGGPVLANPDGRLLAAIDLHVRGTGQLTGELPIPAQPGGWTRVKRLVQCPVEVGDFKGLLIEAWNLTPCMACDRPLLKRNRDLVLEAELMDGDPGPLAARHVWKSTPSFEDADTVIAPPPQAGSRDLSDSLQALINANRKVFLPAGVYPVSRPLVLPAGHQLLGVPGLRSVLKPVEAWRPGAMTWMIDTADDAGSASVLMDIAMDTPDIDYLGGLRWRAGRHSIVRHVRAYLAAGRATSRLHNYRIEGGGGGRWYGVFDHAQLSPKAGADDFNYRKVMVSGTTEPLVFYGLNIERGGRSHGQPQNAPFLEIVDSANVCVLGSKQESDGTSIRVLRSRNILLAAVCVTRPVEKDGALIAIHSSRDVAILGCYWFGGTSPLIATDFEGDLLFRTELLGHYREGDPRPVWPVSLDPDPACNPPDALRMQDGRPVDSVGMWRAERRPEILELFSEWVYGRAPVDRPDNLAFEVTGTDPDALGGRAIRQDVTISLNGQAGQPFSMPVVLFLPKAAAGPVPCFLHIMHRARPPFDAASVSSPFWPVERIIARGYATVLYAPTQLDPDRSDGYQDGVRAAFDPPSGRAPDAWGTIAAWAWGASRVLDYLVTNPGIDPGRVAVIGHSRSGKAALWAAAQDERFALVVSNNSGCTGAALARGKTGERIADINRQFPHWFCENYHAFGGREAELPVDQHLLLGLIAPRPLKVASGSEDGWADPRSEFRSCLLASAVYQLHGFDGPGATAFPQPDTTLHAGRIGYHLRPGRHGLTEYDWDRHMDFADLQFGCAGSVADPGADSPRISKPMAAQ